MIILFKTKLEDKTISMTINLDNIFGYYETESMNKENSESACLFLLVGNKEIPIYDKETAHKIILYFDTKDNFVVSENN